MFNQAFRIKIAYRSKEKEKNTRDRSVPDGSDNYKVFQPDDLKKDWHDSQWEYCAKHPSS